MSILSEFKAKMKAEADAQAEENVEKPTTVAASPTPRKIGIIKPKREAATPVMKSANKAGAKKIGLKIKPKVTIKKSPEINISTTSTTSTTTTASADKTAISGVKPGSAIGKLLAGSSERQETAIHAISPDALAALNSTDVYFDIEKLHSEWPDVSDDTEEDAEERQDHRDKVVKYATAELNNIYLSEMEILQTCDASHPVITNISQIIKLLLQRTKQSPSSIDILDLEHVSAITRGLKLMAAKRQSATTKAKSGAKDLSDALEKSTVVDGYTDDEIMAMGSDLDEIDLGF